MRVWKAAVHASGDKLPVVDRQHYWIKREQTHGLKHLPSRTVPMRDVSCRPAHVEFTVIDSKTANGARETRTGSVGREPLRAIPASDVIDIESPCHHEIATGDEFAVVNNEVVHGPVH